MTAGRNRQSRDEARFLDLVNTLDGIVWEIDTASFNFTYVSPYAKQLLGYPVDDWYRAGFWVEIMHPDDQLWVPNYCLDRLDQQIANYEFEYRVLAKNGEEIWLRDLVSLCFEDGKPSWLRGIMIDISQQKKIEVEIEMSRARFLTIFEFAPIGILLVDTKTNNIIEMNRAYCDLVGRGRQAVLSESWQSYTHAEDLCLEMDSIIKLRDGQISHYSFVRRYLKPDGDIVTAQLQVVSIGSDPTRNNAQYLIILEDITERREFEKKIWRQANYDYLTDLPNRNMFQDRVSQLIKEYSRSKYNLAILMIDLDGFKNINDALGHNIGDELLIATAERVKSCIRESDTLARLGDDEFVVILTRLNSPTGAEQVATYIIDSLSNVFELEQERIFISASIGIATYPDDGSEVPELLKNADQAMYLAKQNGRNRYQFFTRDLQGRALNRMALINDLRAAIPERQFELYYQPIIGLSSGRVFKAEALIRWNHASRGFVSPAEFIPLAEESRLIVGIGDWVFREAIDQQKKWGSRFNDDFQISINASPIQFETTFYKDVTSYLEEKGVSGRNVGIEITETLFMTSNDQVLEALSDFRDSGIQISLDDFGTGYSSLSYLKKFHIDFLKIDKSFVQNLTDGSDDLVLCAAITMMAHKLGIKVIAEGIETSDQLELLRSVGCDYGQGYFFSRPVPALEFERKYAS